MRATGPFCALILVFSFSIVFVPTSFASHCPKAVSLAGDRLLPFRLFQASPVARHIAARPYDPLIRAARETKFYPSQLSVPQRSAIEEHLKEYQRGQTAEDTALSYKSAMLLGRYTRSLVEEWIQRRGAGLTTAESWIAFRQRDAKSWGFIAQHVERALNVTHQTELFTMEVADLMDPQNVANNLHALGTYQASLALLWLNLHGIRGKFFTPVKANPLQIPQVVIDPSTPERKGESRLIGFVRTLNRERTVTAFVPASSGIGGQVNPEQNGEYLFSLSIDALLALSPRVHSAMHESGHFMNALNFENGIESDLMTFLTSQGRLLPHTEGFVVPERASLYEATYGGNLSYEELDVYPYGMKFEARTGRRIRIQESPLPERWDWVQSIQSDASILYALSDSVVASHSSVVSSIQTWQSEGRRAVVSIDRPLPNFESPNCYVARLVDASGSDSFVSFDVYKRPGRKPFLEIIVLSADRIGLRAHFVAGPNLDHARAFNRLAAAGRGAEALASPHFSALLQAVLSRQERMAPLAQRRVDFAKDMMNRSTHVLDNLEDAAGIEELIGEILK